jgi:AraC family transcriptional regulator
MKTTTDDPITRPIECSRLPVLSSQSRGWRNILVEQFQHPAGEGATHYPDQHSICLSLAPYPVSMLQIQDDKTYTGAYARGDFCITPAQVPLFARWESDDCFLQIRLASRLIETVAAETVDRSPNCLELLPANQMRDPQIETIGTMLLSELNQENVGSGLYIESLTNLLAIHLIRQYVSTKSYLPIYEGGLAQRQLLQVLDYINDHLHKDVKLSDLAALLNISQFHFSHLFKQSTGIAPYQYLLQQRIERAKQLLRQSDQSIIEIAFLCGFNSHSHLSKQFRQLTGNTPKAYRAEYKARPIQL